MGTSGRPERLQRQVGLPGAILLGLGSILGTGVFVSVGIATEATGPAVVLAIVVAGLVATCNALSSAQLAASHPVSGGTYEYGYHYLAPALGFSAGWLFLCAKTASAATAALGFAGYVLSGLGGTAGWRIPLALLAVAVLTALVLSGMHRSNRTNAIIVSVTIAALIAFSATGLRHVLDGGLARFSPFFEAAPGQARLGGFLEATALMFVAYTGYGRIATLGEEIHDPRHTIPKAIALTLAVSLALYVLVAVTGIGSVGGEAFAAATRSVAAPLTAVLRDAGSVGVSRLVAVGAVTAMLGVLLNLILGLSRVFLAMARRGDMPGALSKLDPSGVSPRAAVAVTGILVACLVLIGDVRTTWSFSAFTVLLYYGITNLAALRLQAPHRLYPRFVALLGLIACGFLAFWVDRTIWLSGLGVVFVGLGWHTIARHRRRTAGAR